ncbi:hypothetical protein KDN32_18720 [Nocardioides sp. J2M5]|uniref:hypothetical protein n=1 Tax=Nocardioides palaemonis TaxID=2829810 RepID=UPI001BA51B41|nr:hypothetical protein [Nocardioides palaemonis]MBS2939780.1 hypothetical protein [Nocardioides palaemonis]
MRLPALATLLLLPALAACSGAGSPDPADRAREVSAQEDAATSAWRSAVEDELGSDTYDFDALRAAASVDCARTSATEWTVRLALSGDPATSALTRIGLEHACADVVAAFDEAVVRVEAAADPLDLVCGPGVELSADDRLQADLVCANR